MRTVIDYSLCDGGEIILRPQGLCNLSEVVVRSTDSLEDIARKIRIAAIIGTFQSTLTNFRYVSADWKRNAEEERLLGVSLTGIQDNKRLGLNSLPSNLKDDLLFLRQEAIESNKEWAEKLGIPQSAAITTVNFSSFVE